MRAIDSYRIHLNHEANSSPVCKILSSSDSLSRQTRPNTCVVLCPLHSAQDALQQTICALRVIKPRAQSLIGSLEATRCRWLATIGCGRRCNTRRTFYGISKLYIWGMPVEVNLPVDDPGTCSYELGMPCGLLCTPTSPTACRVNLRGLPK